MITWFVIEFLCSVFELCHTNCGGLTVTWSWLKMLKSILSEARVLTSLIVDPAVDGGLEDPLVL